jgi:uncharacterized protein (TIGR02265 family)
MRRVMATDGSTLVPFKGDLDLEKLVSAVPAGHMIKGAFVASNAAILGDEWERVAPTLSMPPRGGKYVTFSDYPVTDFLRVGDAAARKKYPSIGTREGHRLLARNTFEVFSRTTLGRVTLTLVSGPASLLSKYEEIFNRMCTGPRVKVKVVDDKSVHISYNSYFSTREAIFGVTEGAVIACHFEPTVTVESLGAGRYEAVVSWVPW